MDAEMRKHGMTRWLVRLFVVLSLVMSWGVQAVTLESVPMLDPPGKIWCSSWDYTNGYPLPAYCLYPTELAAAQAFIVAWNAERETIPYCKGGYCAYTLTGCNGNGHCTVTVPSEPRGNSFYVSTVPVYCPIPTVDPTNLYVLGGIDYGYMCVRYVSDQCQAPNVINPDTGKCEPPKTLTITIEPAGPYLPSNGTYTVRPSTTLPLNAVVKNQNGVVQAGKQVSLSVSVQDGTDGVKDGNGGHIHTENRPKGKFACSSVWNPGSETATCTLTTDSNGQAPFIFIPTAISGAHTITATCNGCSTTTTAPVNVKVDNLITIPASPLYALSDSNGVIGAIPGKHTDNHYLTETAIGKLGKLAGIYVDVNPGAKLYLNDASLVWGGLFDVGATPWASPHSLHDKGRSLDIRAANSGPNNEGSVPATLFSKFADTARKKGFNIGLHCKNSTDTNYCLGQPNNRHFHVDF